ncbi:MAG: thioredoxin family protein [Candidatus Nanopelagicales bacterium]
MSQQGLWIVCAVLVIVGFGGAWLKRNNGKFKESEATEQGDELVLTEAELGQPLGSSLTVVQFSSTFCQPCISTKRVIAFVLDKVTVPGIESVEINAEENLDLTRDLSIMRTPTVLLVNPDGKVVSRASGELRPQQFVGALGQALGFDGASVDVSIR